jgi:hypothetical protein
MNFSLKKLRRKSAISESPNVNFRAPPYDVFSAFQPWGFYKRYHLHEVEKMKRSYEWIQLLFESERIQKKINPNKIEVELPLIFLIEGISNIEINESEENQITDIPTTIPFGEERKQKAI